MRLLDHIRKSKKDDSHAEKMIGFWVHYYKVVMQDEDNRKEFLCKLKELRHD